MKNIILLWLLLAQAATAAVSIVVSTNLGSLSVSGTVTAGSFVGDGSSLTGILTGVGTNQPIPFYASNTIVVLDGDSKMVGLAEVLTNYPWWKDCAKIYNVAVGGTGLGDVTNAWQTNTAGYSTNLINGTNGLYLLWCMAGDVAGDLSVEIGRLTNHVTRVMSSNWNVILFTVQNLRSSGHAAKQFVPTVNNYIRQWAPPWRVVDVEQVNPDPENTSVFSDGTHLTLNGYTNVANETCYQLLAPYRHMIPQTWVTAYGTNIVFNYPKAPAWTIAAEFDGGAFMMPPSNPNQWPTSANVNGECAIVNSNGTVYLLTSPSGSTAWAATNKLAP